MTRTSHMLLMRVKTDTFEKSLALSIEDDHMETL